jgi:DICT domain-containing protein
VSVQREPGTPDRDAPQVGIGELARRTGLTQQVIRAWESRFGFPEPWRTPSGQRRYDPRDVDRIARVLTLKESGSRLAEAIARVRQEHTDGRHLSVYGELRRSLPQLESRLMRRDVLVAISHAIEDEALARASRPLVFGAFQREEFYLRSAPRWEELARTADGCVVFADFPDRPDLRGRPVRAPLDEESPLLREWAVVVTSDDFSVVLTAWEVPERESSERGFETIFTFEPEAVRIAVDVCLAAARSAGVSEDRLLRGESAPGRGARTHGAGVDALILRAFGYLQQVEPQPSSSV